MCPPTILLTSIACSIVFYVVLLCAIDDKKTAETLISWGVTAVFSALFCLIVFVFWREGDSNLAILLAYSEDKKF